MAEFCFLGARGHGETEVPAEIPYGKGHVGRVIEGGEVIYRPQLSADPDGFVFAEVPPQPESSLTVPVKWYAHGSPGALQVTSQRGDAFTPADCEAIARLGSIASLALMRLYLIEKGQPPAAFHASSSWSDLLINLALESSRTTVDVLQARKRLYDGLCEEAERVSGSLYDSIRLPDPRTGGLRFVACRGEGWTAEKKQHYYDPTERSIGMAVFRSKAPRYLADVSEGNVPFYPINPEVQSVYAVPICDPDGNPLGVLSLDWDVKDGAPQETRAAINQLVADFEKVLAVLEQREDALFRQYEEMFSARSTDLRDVGDVLVDTLRRMFHAKACSLFLRRPEEDYLELLSSTATRPASGRVVYRLGQGLTGWVAEKRKSLRLTDVSDRRELKAISKNLENANIWNEEIGGPSPSGKRGFLAAPLMAGNETVGVVRLTVKDDGEFTHEEESILMEIASRIGRSIREMWRDEVATAQLRAGTPVFEASGDLKTTLQAVADALCRAADADGGLIAVQDSMTGTDTQAGSGLLKLAMAGGYTSDGGEELFSPTIETGGAWHRLNAVLARHEDPLKPVASVARIPLRFPGTGDYAGHALLVWRNMDFFLPDRRLYLSNLAARFTEALTPALSQHRMAMELRQIKDVVLQLAETHDFTKLMESALERVRAAAHMEHGRIRLWDETSKCWRAPSGGSRDQVPEFLKDNALLQRAAQNPRPWLIEDTEADDLWKEFRRGITDSAYLEYINRIGSALHIPLRIGEERCFGIILLEGERPHSLDESTLDYLTILSQVITLAVWFAQDQNLSRPLALLGSMLSGFLHVIGNSLNDAYASLSVAREMANPLTKMQEQIGDLGKRLDNISDVAEAIARASLSGCAELGDVVDINEVATDILAYFSARATQELSLGTELDKKPPLVRGATELLKTAFNLIVQNALEAMGDRGKLTIRTTVAGSFVQIQFIDDGPGMDEETRRHCFDFFYTTKGPSRGAGMGLPVVKGVVLRHGGTVVIDSAPGKGCTVRITLPLTEA